MPTITPPDFRSQHFKANPFPFYARLRQEAPVYHFTSFTKEPTGW
ncbi:hypothetical protein ACN28S_23110 [Cystobacter fuscus]